MKLNIPNLGSCPREISSGRDETLFWIIDTVISRGIISGGFRNIF